MFHRGQMNDKMLIPSLVLQRIKDLEDDLDAEARTKTEQQKAIKKNDRKLKEMVAQADEDRRTIEKLQDANERNNKKMTSLRRRAEEAVSNNTYF